MTLPRKILSFLAAVGVIAGLVNPALASEPPLERQLIDLINQERLSNGLNELDMYWDLRDDARSHSRTMMETQVLHHNPELGAATSGWYSLGENVGVGPFISTLHTAFMNSSRHRANVLGNYNYVGVGVEREAENKIWVTVVFMRGPDGLAGGGNGAPTTTTQPPAQDDPPADEATNPPPADDGGDDGASNDGSGKKKNDKSKKQNNKDKKKKKKAKDKNDKKREENRGNKKGRRGCQREVPGGACAS